MQKPTCRDRRRVEGGTGTDRAGLATDSGWRGKYQELGWLPATYGTRILRLPKVEQKGSETSKETKGTKQEKLYPLGGMVETTRQKASPGKTLGATSTKAAEGSLLLLWLSLSLLSLSWLFPPRLGACLRVVVVVVPGSAT